METMTRLEKMRGDDDVVVPTTGQAVNEIVEIEETDLGEPNGSDPYNPDLTKHEIGHETLLTDKALQSVFTTWKVELRDDADGLKSAWA